MILSKKDNEKKVIYVRCECGTHGVEIARYADCDGKWSDDICIALMTDSFYSKQYGFWRRLKDKCKKIFWIITGKSYRIENDIVLCPNDIEELIEALKKFKGADTYERRKENTKS